MLKRRWQLSLHRAYCQSQQILLHLNFGRLAFSYMLICNTSERSESPQRELQGPLGRIYNFPISNMLINYTASVCREDETKRQLSESAQLLSSFCPNVNCILSRLMGTREFMVDHLGRIDCAQNTG
jgi:hypothetical protein